MRSSSSGLKVVIMSAEGDTHANAVAWALRKRGHRPVLWFVTDFPDRQSLSARVGTDGRASVRLREGERDTELCDADVVWHRRYVKPSAPEAAHAADRAVIETESDAFLRGIVEMLPQDAFWVNPLHASLRANFKPVQLSAAARLGLVVPETCMSNDPEAVRAFHGMHRARDLEVILKTFRQQAWRGDKASYVLTTTPVREDIFRDPRSIQWCPAIYQPRLRKAFEVRAAIMGEAILALRVNSQERKETANDWRLLHDFPVSVEAMELPTDIACKSRALMRELGIVFGCIDFVVSPEGEYTFLEVNEMGQFLWMEGLCPALPMLSAFTDFLESRDASFASLREASDGVSSDNYFANAECRLELQRQQARRRKLPQRVMEA